MTHPHTADEVARVAKGLTKAQRKAMSGHGILVYAHHSTLFGLWTRGLIHGGHERHTAVLSPLGIAIRQIPLAAPDAGER